MFVKLFPHGLSLYRYNQRDFCSGEPQRSEAGAEKWELLLVQVQALLCLCVTLWYLRPFMVTLWSGQPGLLPMLRARFWVAGCRCCTGSPPCIEILGKAIVWLQCSSVHRPVYSYASAGYESFSTWVTGNYVFFFTHETGVWKCSNLKPKFHLWKRCC